MTGTHCCCPNVEVHDNRKPKVRPKISRNDPQSEGLSLDPRKMPDGFEQHGLPHNERGDDGLEEKARTFADWLNRPQPMFGHMGKINGSPVADRREV